ncbi:hypothetical protein DES53_106203 [Roseimicrobium gellanilyticum]|uniref:Uncharacterized protein n=1 Tax=Roseimicrobium gellanilyticum TaxID=748857 RepID=A0A366HJS3_9BACT|nr:hypothetical protein [Roseimicrobium gellanilyticum]RBP42494.1 hypothetical protein DES53_106203 [Roseimicrobium gellanilyticum]
MPGIKDSLSKACRVIGILALMAAVPLLLWLGTQEVHWSFPTLQINSPAAGRELERAVSFLVEKVEERLPDYIVRYDSTSDSYTFTPKSGGTPEAVTSAELKQYVQNGNFRERTFGFVVPADPRAEAPKNTYDPASPLRAALGVGGAKLEFIVETTQKPPGF